MPTGFSDLIEKHPLTTVVGASMTAVAATFSVVSYFNSQQIELVENQYQIEKEELEKQIHGLQIELSSIPSATPFAPGIPNEGLLKIVDPRGMPTEPGKYELLVDLRDFPFYATVDPDIWTVRPMSEAAHSAQFSGIQSAEIFSAAVRRNIEQQLILKWEPSSNYHLKIRFKDRSAEPLILTPFIMVQFIHRDDNARYLRLLNSIMSPHIARAKDRGLDSIKQLAAILEDGSGLKGQPTPDHEIGIYRSRHLLSHVLFFILNEAHQPLLFDNKSEIIETNIFDARDLVVLTLKIKEEGALFEDGTEGEVWVTREAYVLKHPEGHVVIWTYIPSRDRAPDENLALQVEDWIKQFRMSSY